MTLHTVGPEARFGWREREIDGTSACVQRGGFSTYHGFVPRSYLDFAVRYLSAIATPAMALLTNSRPGPIWA